MFWSVLVLLVWLSITSFCFSFRCVLLFLGTGAVFSIRMGVVSYLLGQLWHSFTGPHGFRPFGTFGRGGLSLMPCVFFFGLLDDDGCIRVRRFQRAVRVKRITARICGFVGMNGLRNGTAKNNNNGSTQNSGCGNKQTKREHKQNGLLWWV